MTEQRQEGSFLQLHISPTLHVSGKRDGKLQCLSFQQSDIQAQTNQSIGSAGIEMIQQIVKLVYHPTSQRGTKSITKDG